MTPPYPLGHPTLHSFLTEQIPPLEGWCSVEKAIRLAELVIEHATHTTDLRRSFTSVDLGVFGGKSTLALAIGHLTAQRGYVCGIDTWRTAETLEGTNDLENAEWWKTINLEALYAQVQAYFQQHVPVGCWQILRCRTVEAADYFDKKEVAILHQDSNHSEETSCAELEAWAEKMAPGGLWIMDDADWPSLQLVQQVMVGELYRFVLKETHEGGHWKVYEVPR